MEEPVEWNFVDVPIDQFQTNEKQWKWRSFSLKNQSQQNTSDELPPINSKSTLISPQVSYSPQQTNNSPIIQYPLPDTRDEPVHNTNQGTELPKYSIAGDSRSGLVCSIAPARMSAPEWTQSCPVTQTSLNTTKKQYFP